MNPTKPTKTIRPDQTSRRPSRRTGALLLFVVLVTGSAGAQTNLFMIDHEWADTVEGPWSRPPSDQTYVQPDGSLVTLSSEPQKFFRLSVQAIDFDDVQAPVVQVVQLLEGPTAPRTIAQAHLQWLAETVAGNDPADPEPPAWAGARLAPIAYKVFDPAYRNGEEPAYLEFKIVSNFEPAVKPAEFLVGNEALPVCDLGHILVSLHEGDVPVPEYSDEGLTPCEELLKRVGSSRNIKIMRFGPTFATVENEDGELLANAGTSPFQVPHGFAGHQTETFRGDFDSEAAEEPPREGWGGPPMIAKDYSSYEEFKEDYLNNPVYQAMREHKRRRAAGEWAVQRGETPPETQVIRALLGTTTHLLPGWQVTRYFLDDDEGEVLPLASIGVDQVEGGLRIDGNREGAAPLTVQTADGTVSHFELMVSATAGGVIRPQEFTPGWQSAQLWVARNGFEDTPRYWQAKDGHLWCPQVGCGPVAWAMLLGWWDNQSVPASFYVLAPADLTVVDAPLDMKISSTTLNDYLHVKGALAQLHEYCDVICSAGATPPGDMVEAGPTYLWVPKTLGYLGYTSAWSWDLMDPDWNEPSSYIRSAIKADRPAIIGLGWLWHYALAYAYQYQEFKISPDTVVLRRRWFKCNMGWQNKNKGAWYSGGDTFLGASIRPWQK